MLVKKNGVIRYGDRVYKKYTREDSILKCISCVLKCKTISTQFYCFKFDTQEYFYLPIKDVTKKV